MAWWHSVFRDSSVPTLILDSTGRIRMANPAGQELVGRRSLTGIELRALVPATDRASVDAFLGSIATTPAGRAQTLGPITLECGGLQRRVQVSGSMGADGAGAPFPLLTVQALPTADEADAATTSTDPLTGLGTRTRGIAPLERQTSPESIRQIVIDDGSVRRYGRRREDLDPEQRIRELESSLAQERAEARRAQNEARRAQEEARAAQEQARRDVVTGLPNLLAFEEHALRLQERARGDGTPLSAVFLDTDEFGSINKAFSWEHGSRTLASVADVLAAECREADLVHRYGGEEFVVLLPDTDFEGGLVVAERLRAAVETAAIPHQGHPELRIVTVSVGVATGSGRALDIAALVRRADLESQQAKRAGRNRVFPQGGAQPPIPTAC